MNGAPAKPMSGVRPSSPSSIRTVSATGAIWSGSRRGSRDTAAASRTGSAITGPVPGTMSRSTPAAARGTTMSLNRIAASTWCLRTGWSVISQAMSGVRHAWSIGTPARSSRYSGSDLPA